MTLLEETLDFLKSKGKGPSDILWVGLNAGCTDWETFEKAAKNFEYYSGFGGQYVPASLVLVGKDFWIERHEYDGSEWWEFKKLPEQNGRRLESLDFNDEELQGYRLYGEE